MGLWSDFTEYFRRTPQNPNRVSKVVETGKIDRPLPHPHDYRRFADEGYRRNVVIYACVRFWAATVSQVRLVAKRGDPFSGENELLPPEHELSRLLRKPNPEQAQPAYLRQLITFLQVAGNSYSHKVRPRSKTAPAVELWQLRPDRTKIVPDASGFVSGFEFPSDQPRRAQIIPCEDVSHVRLEDPLNDYYGLSPIATLARQGDIDNEAADFIRSLFMNAGMPSAIMKVVSDGSKPTREELDAAEQRWADKFGRAPAGADFDGRGRVAFIANDVEMLATAAKLDELAPKEIFSHTESRICAAFNVPPILVGVNVGLERSTYSNYSEALKDFWSDGAAPMWTHIANAWSNDIAMDFGDDIFIVPDLSMVDALKEDRQQRAERGLAGWEKGVLTMNEARDHLDVDPLENGRGELLVWDLQPVSVPAPGGQQAFGQAYTLPIRMLPAETQVLPVDKVPKEPIWKKLHVAADKEQPKIRRAVVKAAEVSQDEVPLRRIADRLRAKDVVPIETTLIQIWQQNAVPILKEVLIPTLSGLHQKGVEAGESELPMETQAAAPKERHASVSPEMSDEFAASLVAELVTSVDEGTRLAIRQTIERMFSDGFSADEAARRIRDMIGLNRPQAAALRTLEDTLRKEGLKGAALERRLLLRSSEMVRERAELIARTESIRAISEGQSAIWEAAVEEGVLDAGQTKFWITTDDDRACPLCIPMDGQTVEMREMFTTGGGEQVRHPPVHPACRCAVGLT